MNTREALERMLQFAKEGKLGAMNDDPNTDSGCVYHNRKTNQYCAIGCLLPPGLLEKIYYSGMNSGVTAAMLLRYEPVTGEFVPLAPGVANALQSLHDYAYNPDNKHVQPDDFTMVVEALLSGELTYIPSHPTRDEYSRLETVFV